MQVYQDKLTVDNINSFTKLRLVLREIMNSINSGSGGGGGYNPPSGGIPKKDLASSVQTTLNNADSDHTTVGNLETFKSNTLKWMAGIETLLNMEDETQDIIDSYAEIEAFIHGMDGTTTLAQILATCAKKNEAVLSDNIREVKVLSQAAFDALVSLDPNTEYNITES